MLLVRVQQHVDAQATHEGNVISLTVTPPPLRRGKTSKPNLHANSDQHMRGALSELMRVSHRKLAQLNASPLQSERLVHMKTPVNEWTRMRISVGLLAPDIQKALLQGTAPAHITPEMLLSADPQNSAIPTGAKIAISPHNSRLLPFALYPSLQKWPQRLCSFCRQTLSDLVISETYQASTVSEETPEDSAFAAPILISLFW